MSAVQDSLEFWLPALVRCEKFGVGDRFDPWAGEGRPCELGFCVEGSDVDQFSGADGVHYDVLRNEWVGERSVVALRWRENEC